MNMTKIAAGVTLAVSAVAAQAAPVTLATFAAQPATFTTVDISGATAQETMIEIAMGLVCATDSLAAYRGSLNQRIMMCEIDAAKLAGFPTTRILVRKSGTNGSADGVQPVADATAIPGGGFLIPGNMTCPALPAAANEVHAAPLISYYRVNCTANGALDTTAIPDVGLSDVEPALFGATDAQLGALTIAPTNDLNFGIAVSKKFYDRLQIAQGLNNADDQGRANMPSLTFEQVTGIFANTIFTIDQLVDIAGAKLTNTLAPANIDINVCRRVDSSGTQKTTEVVFLNSPCATGVGGLAMPSDSSATLNDHTNNAAGNTTHENNGSGDLRNCLAARDDLNWYSVGLLSTETVPVAATKFRFVKVDGVAPTIRNTADGDYRYWATNTLQYNTAGIGAAEQLFADKLVASLQSADVVKAINTTFRMWSGTADEWQGGYLVPSPNSAGVTPTTPIVSDATVVNNPVNATGKQALGSVQNCQLPAPAFEETSTP